jgi:plastocyanin
MLKALLAAVTMGAIALALSASAFSGGTSSPKLVGTVGPAFKITLTKGGSKVKTLPAGSYTFVIHDKASIHAFSLDGPHGFAHDFTKIPFVGTKTATIKLKAGKYKYYCPNHESTMFGHFTVK